MARIEEVLDSVWEDIKGEVATQIKAHPDYEQLVKHLAELGVQQLITMAGG